MSEEPLSIQARVAKVTTECAKCFGCGHLCEACGLPVNACPCDLDTEQMSECARCKGRGWTRRYRTRSKKA